MKQDPGGPALTGSCWIVVLRDFNPQHWQQWPRRHSVTIICNYFRQPASAHHGWQHPASRLTDTQEGKGLQLFLKLPTSLLQLVLLAITSLTSIKTWRRTVLRWLRHIGICFGGSSKRTNMKKALISSLCSSSTDRLVQLLPIEVFQFHSIITLDPLKSIRQLRRATARHSEIVAVT